MYRSVVTYFFLEDAPTPVTPLRSTQSTTTGGAAGRFESVPTCATRFACPEKDTLSDGALAVPWTVTATEVVAVVVWALAGALHPSRVALNAKKSESKPRIENKPYIFMVVLLSLRTRSAGCRPALGTSRPAASGSASAAAAGTERRRRRSPSARAWRCPRAPYYGSAP